MHILELPLEVVDNILYYSILARNFRRALRLQLVCKSFRAAFKPILYRSRSMDNIYVIHDFTSWGPRRHRGADLLWHDYLVFRARGARDEKDSCYGDLRTVADVFARHCQTDQSECALTFEEILDRICWLVLIDGGVLNWRGWDREDRDPPSLGQDLLSVATYFGCTSLVKELLDQGHDPAAEYQLFPAPMYIAAYTGQAEMLGLIQEHLPHHEAQKRVLDHPSGCRFYSWRSKIGPWSLYGAARRGEMEMVRLALNPPMCEAAGHADHGGEGDGSALPEDVPTATSMLARNLGSVPPASELGGYLLRAMDLAGTPEIYQHLHDFLDPAKLDPQTKHDHLARAAAAGNAAMARHLLGQGAAPSHPETNRGTALLHAVRGWHEDVVELLLVPGGADPNHVSARSRFRTPLTAAAQAGSMTLLRRLLAAGARPQRSGKDVYTLRQAVRREHTAMVVLLLDDLGVGSERQRGVALKVAEAQGLESMADLFRARGVTYEGKELSRAQLFSPY